MIEPHIIDLGYAKKLDELGVKKESIFSWYQRLNVLGEDPYVGITRKAQHNPKEIMEISAYTASELMEILPSVVDAEGHDVFLCAKKDIINYYVAYCTSDGDLDIFSDFKDESISNALAKMLIFMVENKLVEVK